MYPLDTVPFMSSATQTIRVSKETKDDLIELGKKNQSYNDIVSELIELRRNQNE